MTLIALKGLDNDDLAAKIPVLLETDAKRAMDINELNSLLGLPGPEITRICSELAKAGKIVMLPAPAPILVLPHVVESLRKETLAQISEFHKENLLQKGISKEELRKRFYDDLPIEVFRYCLDGLAEKRKITFLEDAVSLYGREIQLSAEEQKVRELIEALIKNAGLSTTLNLGSSKLNPGQCGRSSSHILLDD